MLVRALSPLLETDVDCHLIKTVSVDSLRAAYLREFGYDAKEEFAGVDSIRLLECPQTRLKFFTPISVVGREGLYRRLETFEWNYKETKWEHEVSASHVREGQRVLDVGCGRAAFLERCMRVRGAVVRGLEFNGSAARYGRERGVEVLSESIEDHAVRHAGQYDVVTSFQVLEHVVSPAAFLRACVAVIRPGGSLILGVPNNDGFLGVAEENWLDMPPHHMTLWGRASLACVGRLFGLDHVDTCVEPLQERDWYRTVYERRHLRGRIRRFLYYRLGFNRFFKNYIDDVWAAIPGHTILSMFRKA